MFRSILTILLAVNCLLPIAVLLMLGLARLLAALGDEAGASVLGRLSLGGGTLWGLTLISLLLALALRAVVESDETKQS